jgi:hypothetical protein
MCALRCHASRDKQDSDFHAAKGSWGDKSLRGVLLDKVKRRELHLADALAEPGAPQLAQVSRELVQEHADHMKVNHKGAKVAFRDGVPHAHVVAVLLMRHFGCDHHASLCRALLTLSASVNTRIASSHCRHQWSWDKVHFKCTRCPATVGMHELQSAEPDSWCATVPLVELRPSVSLFARCPMTSASAGAASAAAGGSSSGDELCSDDERKLDKFKRNLQEKARKRKAQQKARDTMKNAKK